MRSIKLSKLISFVSIGLILSSSAWSNFRNDNNDRYNDRYNDHNQLAGTWYHDGRTTSINKNGFNQYVFCNENRDCARGFLTGENRIYVSKWSVNGMVTNQNKTIVWSNGTQWVRYTTGAHALNGRWFHDKQPTRIQSYGNNSRFLLTNEMGQSNWGYVQDNKLIIPSLDIVGYLSRGGNQIRWSNNTIWVR